MRQYGAKCIISLQTRGENVTSRVFKQPRRGKTWPILLQYTLSVMFHLGAEMTNQQDAVITKLLKLQLKGRNTPLNGVHNSEFKAAAPVWWLNIKRHKHLTPYSGTLMVKLSPYKDIGQNDFNAICFPAASVETVAVILTFTNWTGNFFLICHISILSQVLRMYLSHVELKNICDGVVNVRY